MERRCPAEPPRILWDLAVGDYERGAVLSTRWIVDEAEAPAYLTRTFADAWATLRLAPDDRLRIQQACIMTAHGVTHPMLPIEICPCDSDGSTRMICPAPGITVTFRPHWEHSDRLVFLTLAVE